MRLRRSLLPHGYKSLLPDAVLVHSMGEFIELGDVDPPAREYLDQLGLSAHSLIHPDGLNERLRDDDQGAFHARGWNGNALGIEFLVPGAHTYATFLKAIRTPYLSSAQYAAGLEQVRAWVKKFNIPRDRVLRHSDVSPGRKYDPGDDGFPWARFVKEVFDG